MAIASGKPVIPSVSSFSFSTQPKKKHHPTGSGGNHQGQQQQQEKSSAPPLSSKEKGPPKQGCLICRTTGMEEKTAGHQPWLCPSLPLIRSKKISPPKELCKQCCNEIKEGVTHRSDCHMIPLKKPEGSTTHVNRSCYLHSGEKQGYIHHKLCTSCGPNLPPAKPRQGVNSFAFRVENAYTNGYDYDYDNDDG